MKTFGEYIKELRISKEITLREFCKIAKHDPSNWSKIERGILPPPKGKIVLENIALTLKLPKGSEEYYNIFDLAAISFIPKENYLKNYLFFLEQIEGKNQANLKWRNLQKS